MTGSKTEIEELRSEIAALKAELEHFTILHTINVALGPFIIMDYTVKKEEVSGRKCRFCLKPIDKGDSIIRTLTCTHSNLSYHLGFDFHQSCVDSFIHMPVSKRNALTEDIPDDKD